jgi:hypothetical protein
MPKYGLLVFKPIEHAVQGYILNDQVKGLPDDLRLQGLEVIREKNEQNTQQQPPPVFKEVFIEIGKMFQVSSLQ